MFNDNNYYILFHCPAAQHQYDIFRFFSISRCGAMMMMMMMMMTMKMTVFGENP